MQEENHFIPVIVLTANAIEGIKDEYLSAAMDGDLAKSIEMDKLIIEFEKCFNKQFKY